eukprot:10089667-Alexandrium_andersonii.AAC.1
MRLRAAALPSPWALPPTCLFRGVDRGPRAGARPSDGEPPGRLLAQTAPCVGRSRWRGPPGPPLARS